MCGEYEKVLEELNSEIAEIFDVAVLGQQEEYESEEPTASALDSRNKE